MIAVGILASTPTISLDLGLPLTAEDARRNMEASLRAAAERPLFTGVAVSAPY